MKVTFFENEKIRIFDVWFNVLGEGREVLGTFDDIDKAIKFARDENRQTTIEVEYS